MMTYQDLKNKVVIVTGANHGIGQAAAVAFAEAGAKVLVTYYRAAAEGAGQITNQQAADATEPSRALYYKMQTKTGDETVELIEKIGGQCCAVEADLADPANIPMLFDKAEEALGPVDIVVNNAAFCRLDTFIPPGELEKKELFAEDYPMTTITAASHDDHFAVNSRGTALMMAEYAKRFIKRKASSGRIINISSDGAHAHPSAISYGASKLAMESYSRAAASELGPYGITVNVVSPGAVQTGWIPPDTEKQISQSYPLRRIGLPDDIAKAILFLASKQADWITGQVFHVGGGNWM